MENPCFPATLADSLDTTPLPVTGVDFIDTPPSQASRVTDCMVLSDAGFRVLPRHVQSIHFGNVPTDSIKELIPIMTQTAGT